MNKIFRNPLFTHCPREDAPEKAPLPDAKDSTFHRPSPRQVVDQFLGELQRTWSQSLGGHPHGE